MQKNPKDSSRIPGLFFQFFFFGDLRAVQPSNGPREREGETGCVPLSVCEGLLVFNFKNRTVFMFRATNSLFFELLSPVVTCVFVDFLDTSVLRCCCLDQSSQLGVPVVVCVTEGACFFVVWALPGGGGGGEDNGPTTGARGHDYDAFGLLID